MRNPNLIASTLAAVLLAAAAAAPATAAERGDPAGERIINGHAPTQLWPSQTSVRFTATSGSYVCGGTLVSARWVLTAAHCATNDDGSALAAGAFSPVRVGSVSRTTGGHTAAVDAVHRHPDYADTGAPRNDVTLLHLATAVPEEPLELVGAGDTSLWSSGADATIIGWGVTETGSTSTTLREAQVTMTADTPCLDLWGLAFNALSMVCALGDTTDTCSGDSGGPLMVRRDGAFVLAGVTSWGASPCGDPDYPGVYARVGADAISSWVRGYVPAAGIAVSPAIPVVGEQVTLNATLSPGAQGASPALAWDLDDDGLFDDATGSSANVTFDTSGAPIVRVQATYPDGDRAVARKRLAVPDAVPATPPVTTPPVAPPPPPPPPPLPAAPAPQATPQQIEQLLEEPPAIGTVTAPVRMKLSTLRSKGLRVRITCELACEISGRLRRGDTTLGRAGGSLQAGKSRTVTVRLTARAKRSLRGRKQVTLRFTTQLRSGAETLQVSRRIAAIAS